MVDLCHESFLTDLGNNPRKKIFVDPPFKYNSKWIAENIFVFLNMLELLIVYIEIEEGDSMIS